MSHKNQQKKRRNNGQSTCIYKYMWIFVRFNTTNDEFFYILRAGSAVFEGSVHPEFITQPEESDADQR